MAFSKVLRFGLWSIWLSGLLLTALSLYFTQLLHSFNDGLKIKMSRFDSQGSARKGTPSITIFSAPGPFAGSLGDRQALAVRSWLGLSPDINVVLFGSDPSLESFAASFGSRVLVEPNIDFSFLGTPFFHSMIARSQASLSDISVLIDPKTILLPDFLSTLRYAHELRHDWFIVSSPRRIPFFPFYMDEAGKQWFDKDGKWIKMLKLQEFLLRSSCWDSSEEKMLMAWNNKDMPLHVGVLPPFLYGKGIHSHWFINEVFYSNYRLIFDASWTISSFYVSDSSHHEYLECGGGPDFPQVEKKVWECNGNLHLGDLYGVFSSHKANLSDLFKLVKCHGKFMFTKGAQQVIYSSEHMTPNSQWMERVMRSARGRRILDCFARFSSPARNMGCPRKNMSLASPIHLPFDLESLLSVVADENRTIVLAVAGYSYKDFLMSWACRLRHLSVRNFLVCALDDETYEFSILQGLPVFKDSLAPSNISFDDCHFGTKCFQKVTKTKSRLVLQILKLGYNVLLSDVDVYWFKNPISLLQSFGPTILVAQSDEYNLTGPINLPRRLNSGFYFAYSDNSTIAAMEKVVKHALVSELSEQPSFYDTLCGEGGSYRVGDDKCRELETNVVVHFLDRDLFPNGAYQGLWEKRNVKAACLKKGCYVLHNNWISGRMKKLERQVHSGLWEYDISSRMCLQSWHVNKMTNYI